MWITDKIEFWVQDEVSKATESIQESITTSIFSVFSYIGEFILEIVTIIVLIYMVYVCYCIMLNRKNINVVFFGEMKPIDSLYFLSCAYVLVAFLKRFIY
jgi:hypothetical protein